MQKQTLFKNICNLSDFLMQKMMKYLLGLFTFFLFSILTACHKDDINPEDDANLPVNQRINRFIETQMKDIYLWAEQIQGIKVDLNKEPADFLKALRYREDLWSTLEENETGTRSSTDGKEKTFGYKIQFYQIAEGLVGGMIQYVYKDSPAAKAGLKRGDMIFTNHGELLNEDNYTAVIKDEKVVLKTGVIYNDTLFVSKQDYPLTQTLIEQEPILLDTVFEWDHKKIGYLVYTHFYNNNSSSLPALSKAIGRIKAAGPDEFILDLRYNTGGMETAAQHLSSLLVPETNVRNEDILIYKQWNPTYQQKKKSNQLITRFKSDVQADNLDLHRIYILTSGTTASASEVLISGLRPYIPDVILIGTPTYGKYVGMSQITLPKDLQQWIFWPVTFTYTNANGESVKGGIAPTYTAKEYDDYLPPFGDKEDPLLGKALELICGEQPVLAAHKTRRSTPRPSASWFPLRNSEKSMFISE